MVRVGFPTKVLYNHRVGPLVAETSRSLPEEEVSVLAIVS